ISAASAQEYGAGDINYLANLQFHNKPYYDKMVMGVARFTGIGIVDSIGDSILSIDMGDFGQVLCIKTPSIQVGDKVRVKGRVGGAVTAAKMAEIAELGA